jgi:single-stranded DNA-binding protein
MAGTTRKAKESAGADPEVESGRLNLVVVCGECAAPPDLRELESGRRLAALSIRARGNDGRATSVPVTVWEPVGWVEDLEAGTEVIVVGAVRQRFFRTAAGTSAARVDVEAAFIGKAAQARGREGARRRVEAALEALMG